MKIYAWCFLLALLGGMLFLSACDGEDDPQPVSLTFNATSATLNGTALGSGAGFYTLTLNFSADGSPNGYTASGSAGQKPTIGASGTFALSGNQVTFTSGGDSRTVAVSGGSLNNTATGFTLTWELTKVDDGVTAAEAGTYVFQMGR